MTSYPGITPGTRFLVAGDSNSASPSSAGTPIWDMFAADFDMTGFPVINTAVNGAVLADLVAAYNTAVKPYRPGGPSNLSHDAILWVWIGVNDVWRLTTNGYANAAAYISALQGYWNTAIADGFRVIAVTIQSQSGHKDLATQIATMQLNAAIRASSIPLYVIDPPSKIPAHPFAPLWWDDGLHNSTSGRAVIYDQLKKTLQAGATLPLPQHAFEANKDGANQTIAWGGDRLVTFENVVRNVGDVWNPATSVLTPTRPMQVFGQIEAMGLSDGDYICFEPFRNGAAMRSGISCASRAGVGAAQFSAFLDADGSSYDFRMTSQSAVNYTAAGPITNTWLWGVEVG